MSAFTPVAGWHPRFRSKIDVWLGGIMLLGILVSAAVAIALLLQKGIASLAIIPLMATGSGLWLLIETWYGVTDTDLIVHCGPFRDTVPVASIRAIRPTRTVVSAPALSLDRLEVTHAGGALVISPVDKAGFISAVRERNPAVQVSLGNGSLVFDTDDPARTRRLFRERQSEVVARSGTTDTGKATEAP